MAILIACCAFGIVLALFLVKNVTSAYVGVALRNFAFDERVTYGNVAAVSSTVQPMMTQAKEAAYASAYEADVSIGLSLTASIIATLFITLTTRNITSFLVLCGVTMAIHAACWLHIEGLNRNRSTGFRVAVFIASFVLLWEVTQLLMTVMH